MLCLISQMPILVRLWKTRINLLLACAVTCLVQFQYLHAYIYIVVSYASQPLQLCWLHSILRLSVEYATREVSRPSFTVKTPLLSRATKQVSIGNIVFY